MDLNEESVLAQFDRLVDAGVVLYDDEQDVIEHVDGNLKFRFIVTTALAKKPLLQGNNDEANQQVQPRSELRPGSDIDTNGFDLGEVNETHFLAMNKFCFIRPHLLLLTKDGHRRQFEALNIDDFGATSTVLKAMGKSTEYTAFFNCGVNGGCSRLHKHIQVIPYPKDNFAAFLDREGEEATNVPFVWYYHHFDFDFGKATPDMLLQIYKKLLEKSTTAAGYDPRDPKNPAPDAACPHNMVLTKRWMLVLPRRKARIGDVATNALGMMGIVATMKQSEMNAWLQLGPSNVLREFGVPPSN